MRRVLIVVAMFAVVAVVAAAPADARRHRPPPTTTRPRPTTTTRPVVTTTRPPVTTTRPAPTTTTETPTMPTYVTGTPLVNVTAYGALCDGTTNDTVAVQNAANAAAGKTLMFPVGTCRVDRVLVPANTHVTGHGPTSIVKQRTLSDVNLSYPVFEVGNNVTISALKIDGNGAANIPPAWTEGYDDHGVNFKEHTGGVGRGYRAGIRGEAVTGLTVTGVEFTAIAGAGVATNNSSQITITGCYIHDSSFELAYISGSTYPVVIPQSGQNVVITGNHVGTGVSAPAAALANGFPTDAIYVSRVRGGNISNNAIDDADRAGIKLQSVQNFDIANNTINGTGFYPLHISGGSTGLTVLSNTDDGAAIGDGTGAFAWPFPNVVNKIGAEHVNTAAGVAVAAAQGVTLSLNYGPVTGALATAMTTYGMKYLDRTIADYIYAVSPIGSGHTPSGGEETTVMGQVTTYLGTYGTDPLIAGYYIYDDYSGNVQHLLELVTAAVRAATPTKPTVCGFGAATDFTGSDGLPYTSHAEVNTAITNYSPAACDIPDFYIYGVGNAPGTGPSPCVATANNDWDMSGIIPYIKGLLAAEGWESTGGFMLTPQAFSDPSYIEGTGCTHYVEPTPATITAQVVAAGQLGATTILAYIWGNQGDEHYLENQSTWRTGFQAGTDQVKTMWGL